MSGRYGTDGVENVLGERGPGDRTDNDVGIGQDVVHSSGDLIGHLSRSLEGDAAGQSDGNVSKVAVAGAADANAIHFQKSVHTTDGIDNATASAGGGSGGQRGKSLGRP